MSAERKVWFGRRAVEWVLDEAPDVPPNLVSTLLGLARHAQDDGTGSCPSVETLMAYTRKSRRQVRYDLETLREKKLIKVSDDQSRVSHIRADRRPVVYELAIPSQDTGCSVLHPVGERGATDCTPSTERGAIQRHTGCNTASNGVQPIAPEKDFEKNLEKNKPSLSGADRLPAPSPRQPEQERDESVSQKPEPLDPIRKILAEHGWTGERANHAITYIDTLPGGPKGQGWYRRLAGNGDLAGILASVPEHPTTPKISYGEHMKAMAGMPPCKHGDPGGNIPKPDDGWKPCAACRWETASQQPRSGQRSASPRVHVDPPERSRGIVGVVASELVRRSDAS